MTPRGLKVRIDIPYAFTLMGRFSPKRTAFDILKTTEGLEDLPSFLSLVGGPVALLFSTTPVSYAAGLIAGGFVGTLVIWFGLFLIPGFRQLATTLSYITGFGLLIGSTAVVGFVFLGWPGLLATAAGWVASVVVEHITDWLGGARISSRLGKHLTRSEIDFLQAYRLHADESGITRDLTVTEEEIRSERWVEVLEDYARDYPESVERFAEDFYEALAGVGRS